MSNPKYVYKILPHSSVDSRYTFPIPIPASHTFFLSELDYKDGFIHLSTAQQVPGTLNRFFKDVPSVTLLRCDFARLSAFKRVIWEKASNGDSFPHLYAHLEGENVDSFKEVHRTSSFDEKGENASGAWDEALGKEDIRVWLE